MTKLSRSPLDEMKAWWRTSIIDIEPNHIRLRGYPIQDLIGKISFPQAIWLMTRGEVPDAPEAMLLEAALVASVDHGPQAPSIAIARMAMTCGVGLNNAMGSAINVLGDVHGGAGEQAMALYAEIAEAAGEDDPAPAIEAVLASRLARKAIIPGFGHRFHTIDPRAVRLGAMLDAAKEAGTVSGRFLAIARGIEARLTVKKGKAVPLNIDGITAVVFSELGFPPALGRGLFILSRSVGVLAHAHEQAGQGGRIKGPMPVSIPYAYEGPAERRYAGEPS